MSIFLYTPTSKLDAASEEFRNKGIAGRRTTPSASMITPLVHFYQPDNATFSANLWMHLAAHKRAGAVYADTDKVFNPSVLPEVPLPLPRCTFAVKSVLQDATIKRMGLRSLPASKTNKEIKAIYTGQLKLATVVEAAKMEIVVSEYSAPPGQGSCNEIRSFNIVRKIIWAMASATSES
jgi:hypothetical protein